MGFVLHFLAASHSDVLGTQKSVLTHWSHTPQLFAPPFISLCKCRPPDECVAAGTITGALYLGAPLEMPALL